MNSKAEIIAEIESSRAALGLHVRETAEAWQPAHLVRRSLERHRWVWIAGSVAAGLALARLLLPPAAGKIRRDNADASATKNSLISQILTPLLALTRQVAAQQGIQLIQNLLTSTIQRPGGDHPGP